VIVISNHRQYKQTEEQLKIQNNSLKIQNDQIKHNFFAEYTKRYQEIILHFPENINDNNFRYDELEKEIKDKTMRYMRVYFDLCSEEYFLKNKGVLDEDVWSDWQEGMISTFNKPAFKIAWKQVTQDSDFYKEFKNFIDSIIKNENGKN
jgi:hypothetical protein